MDVAYSVNRVPIRLTDERWSHIVTTRENLHGYYEDCLRVVENPELVLPGYQGRAVRNYGPKRYLVVVYREVDRSDGFIITAYFARRIDRKKALWRR